MWLKGKKKNTRVYDYSRSKKSDQVNLEKKARNEIVSCENESSALKREGGERERVTVTVYERK